MTDLVDLIKAKIPFLTTVEKKEKFEISKPPHAVIMIIVFEIIWNVIMFGFVAPFLWNSVRPVIMSSKPIKGLDLFKTSILVSIIFGSIRTV